MLDVISTEVSGAAIAAGQPARDIHAVDALPSPGFDKCGNAFNAELTQLPITDRSDPDVEVVSITRDFSDARGGGCCRGPIAPVQLDYQPNLKAKCRQYYADNKANCDEIWNAVHTDPPCLTDIGRFPYVSGYWICKFGHPLRYGKASCGICHIAPDIGLCLRELPHFRHMSTLAQSVSDLNSFDDQDHPGWACDPNSHTFGNSKNARKARDYSRAGAGSVSCARWPRRLAGTAAIQLQDAPNFPPTAQSGGGNPAASAGCLV